MPKRYYITYIVTILGGTVFFALGLTGHLPDISCLFFVISGYPCPSCGLTRSISLAFKGNVLASITMHPFGMFVMFCIAAAMALSAYGIIKRSQLKWLFGKRLTAIAIAAVIVYIAAWVIRLCE